MGGMVVEVREAYGKGEETKGDEFPRRGGGGWGWEARCVGIENWIRDPKWCRHIPKNA